MGTEFGAWPGWRWSAALRDGMGAKAVGKPGANVPSMSRLVLGLWVSGVSLGIGSATDVGAPPSPWLTK